MDFLTDNNPKGVNYVKSLYSDSELPEYIDGSKDSLPTKESVEGLKKSAFANPLTKEYPLNNKQNTWLSAAYYLTQGCNQKFASESIKQSVEEQIYLAASLHGIKSDLVKMASKIKEDKQQKTNVKVASSPVYAFEHEGKNYLNITTAEDLKKSASEIEENKNKIPSVIRKSACIKMLKRAKELNVNVSPFIEKEGIDGAFIPETAKYWLQKRASETKDDTYTKVAESAESYIEGDKREEYSALVYKLDVKNGIHEKYGSERPSPSDIFYSRVFTSNDEKDLLKSVVKIASVGSSPVIVPVQELCSESFKHKLSLFMPDKKASTIIDCVEKNKDDGLKLTMALQDLNLSQQDNSKLLKALI